MTLTTTVPIPRETLRTLFPSTDEQVVIDVDEASLTPDKILIYLTNLNIDATFHFTSLTGFFNLLKAYLKSPMLHDYRQLEHAVLEMLLQIKGIDRETSIDYHEVIVDPDLRETITRWLSLTESLSLYMEKQVTGVLPDAPVNDSTELTGINFVKLLAHDRLPLVLLNPHPSRLVYHHHFYDNIVFRGSTLENYWLATNNALCVIDLALRSGEITQSDLAEKLEESHQELRNTVSV